MAKYEKVTIRGTLVWPFFTQVNEMSKRFQVDVSQLTKEDCKALKAIGLGSRIKTENLEKLKAREAEDKPVFDRGRYITVKSKFPTKVMLNSINNIMEDASSVGNGTIGQVVIRAVPYTDFGGGITAGMGNVLIEDLVSYGSDDDDENDFEIDIPSDVAIEGESSEDEEDDWDA